MLGQDSSRSLRNLVCIAIAIAGAMVLVRGLAVWGLRTDAIDDAFRDAGNIATILAEQTSQSIKAFDATLVAFQQQLVELHEAAPDRYEEAIRSRDIHALLASRLIRLPQSDAITILGPDGHIANFSRGWPAPDTDVSDREFFTVLRRDAGIGMHVALPVGTRISNAEQVLFSRRITSQQGEFLGVVQIGVTIEHFKRLYNSINSLADLSLMFLRSDGTILLRHPELRQHGGEKMPPSSPWHGIVAQGGGFLHVDGLLDSGPRFVVSAMRHGRSSTSEIPGCATSSAASDR